MLQQLWAPHTIFTQTPKKSRQHHVWEQHAGMCARRSSISAQSPTPNRASLSPDPGWNLAPLPLCTQYRWQDRRSCWCRKAVPVLRRWQGRKALAEKGHQGQCLLPWSLPPSRDCWKDLGGRGVSTSGCHIQVFKRPPHKSCVLLDA